MEDKKPMNILIVGNGFDIAHGLPTRYGDFFKFIENSGNIIKYYNRSSMANFCNVEEKFRPFIDKIIDDTKHNKFKFLGKIENKILLKKLKENNIENEKNLFEYFDCIVKNNIWYLICKDQSKFYGRNWVDIESIIRSIINSFDSINAYSNNKVDEIVYYLQQIIPKSKQNNIFPWEIYNLTKLACLMENDLNEFILAFEMYITCIVNRIECYPKIDFRLLNGFVKDKNIKINNLLSFNYTDTYRRIYDTKLNKQNADFIHGRAGQGNIVLGTDEYLSNEEKNKKLNFVRFKKYFQRISKKTGCEYKKWLRNIPPNFQTNVFIIGHSLNVTDKDILQEVILHENVKTTIFYYNEENYNKKIINMIRLIGQDKLIEMVYGADPKIIFRNQEEIMVKQQEQ